MAWRGVVWRTGVRHLGECRVEETLDGAYDRLSVQRLGGLERHSNGADTRDFGTDRVLLGDAGEDREARLARVVVVAEGRQHLADQIETQRLDKHRALLQQASRWLLCYGTGISRSRERDS